MKKILLVLTGGTIGSTVTDGAIGTNPNSRYQLLAMLQAQYPWHEEFAFHVIQPVEILSENLQPVVWETVVAAIITAQPQQYQGIIITHGTDTLAFSASALSFCLQSLNLPILLVSSDYPLADDRANGLANFICALEFIRQIQQAGVFVPYRNQGQTMQVHLATRLASCLQLSGDFITVQQKSYMQFSDGKFSLLNPSTVLEKSPPTTISPRFSQRVMLVKPYPGLNYQHIAINQVDAVLHDLYHSGTAAVSSQWGSDYSLLDFAQRCQQQGVALYLAPSVKSTAVYDTTKALIDHGAIMLWNMSLEAAYAKLLLAYGNFNDTASVMAFMAADIAGEIIESPLQAN